MKKVLSIFLYSEFIFPIKDYFKTITPNEKVFDLLIPIILSVLGYIYIFPKITGESIYNFSGYLINSLAILIGFTITCLTVLITSNNNNVALMKSQYTRRKIYNKHITLFQLILLSFSYALIMEILTLLYNFIFLIIYSSLDLYCKKIIFGINIFLVLHIIALNIRNTTNLYLIHFKNES